MAHSAPQPPSAIAIAAALEQAFTHRGERLLDCCVTGPVLLVFLRHGGCPFCREAVADLQTALAPLHRGRVRVVLVYMGDSPVLDRLLIRRRLEAVDRIADSSRRLYQAFGLTRGRAAQLFGAKVLWRALAQGVLFRYGIGRPAADPAQMPGVFLIENGVITRRFRHRSAADRPDYLKLAGR